MRKAIVGLCVGVVTILALAGPSAAGGKHRLASHVYGCYRAVIQEGRGGAASIDAAYSGLSDLLDFRDSRRDLWTLLEQCQELYDSLEAEEPVERGVFYDRLLQLNRPDPAAGDDRQRQLFVLMVGLRDEVARCRTLSGSVVYSALWGIAGQVGGGLCNNLDGEYYVRSAAGLGLVLGVGLNLTVFPENRLMVSSKETGSLSALTRTIADGVLEEVFNRDGEAWPPSPALFNADLYLVASNGVGLVLPVSGLAASSETEESVRMCLETLGAIVGRGQTEITLPEALAGFAECLRNKPGIALGAGVQIAVVLELPVHFTIPLVRLPLVLRSIIYDGVSVEDTAMVELGAGLLGGFGP